MGNKSVTPESPKHYPKIPENFGEELFWKIQLYLNNKKFSKEETQAYEAIASLFAEELDLTYCRIRTQFHDWVSPFWRTIKIDSEHVKKIDEEFGVATSAENFAIYISRRHEFSNVLIREIQADEKSYEIKVTIQDPKLHQIR
jgi:hypothetical protein